MLEDGESRVYCGLGTKHARAETQRLRAGFFELRAFGVGPAALRTDCQNIVARGRRSVEGIRSAVTVVEHEASSGFLPVRRRQGASQRRDAEHFGHRRATTLTARTQRLTRPCPRFLFVEIARRYAVRRLHRHHANAPKLGRLLHRRDHSLTGENRTNKGDSSRRLSGLSHALIDGGLPRGVEARAKTCARHIDDRERLLHVHFAHRELPRVQVVERDHLCNGELARVNDRNDKRGVERAGNGNHLALVNSTRVIAAPAKGASRATMAPMSEPVLGTAARWALDYIRADSFTGKLAAPPALLDYDAPYAAMRVPSPGRPAELRVVGRAEKIRGLTGERGRARAMHTFFHHELQAAELMAWALLAFPETPRAFREGLVRIAGDEIRHMKIYAHQLTRLGGHLGEFTVRDWFWERVPCAASPAAFVAVMGLGLESANLEHAATYAARFRMAGDEEGARAQERVGAEEIAHVRFGVTWFERLAGRLDFDTWRRALPAPLTPLLMRGVPLQRAARERAGQPEHFLSELQAWRPDTLG